MARIRRNIASLTDDEAQLLILAFAAVKESADPPLRYDTWVQAHSSSGLHHSELFLTWHRAFIFEFESALQVASGDSAVTLPYWDWPGLPSVPDLVLRLPVTTVRYDDEERRERKLDLPSQADVDKVLGLSSSALFGGSGCDGPRGPGLLENIHGLVHTWVGPAMSRLRTSVSDPMFWFLHSNVDRLWALWQRSNTTRLKCPTHSLPGMPGNWTPADLLDIGSPRLDYAYDDPSANVLPSAPHAELRISGLRVEGDGAVPVALLAFAKGLEEPIARISLFGFTHDDGGAHGGGDGHIGGSSHGNHTDGIDLRFVIADGIPLPKAEDVFFKIQPGADADEVKHVACDRVRVMAADAAEDP